MTDRRGFFTATGSSTGYAVPEIVTGKPVSIGGTYGRREAAGRGVVYLIERAANLLKMKLTGGSAVVQGFGNVGAVAAQGLAYKSGMKIIAVSDISGAYYNERGIDILAAERFASERGDLAGFPGAESIPSG